MNPRLLQMTDQWLAGHAPQGHVVTSSRARYARNLAGFPFAPHAKADVLRRVDQFILDAFQKSDHLKAFERIELGKLDSTDRSFLKESRLISKEMERGGEFLTVYMSPDSMTSILVNEEDHLRIQTLSPGFNVEECVARLTELDNAISQVLGYAWSQKYGYLTACPTNVGTGFRASVMLHLPGLTLLKEVENSLQGIAHHGLTVRGFYGENTEYTGDFYQISNEITLGRTVEQIVKNLTGVIRRVIEREEEARIELFKHHATATNDTIWRSFGVLSHAVRMDSSEAMRLLSRLRLGIDHGYFEKLAHPDLNRLVVEIQPAHLERRRAQDDSALSRDEVRALYLRERIQRACQKN